MTIRYYTNSDLSLISNSLLLTLFVLEESHFLYNTNACRPIKGDKNSDGLYYEGVIINLLVPLPLMSWGRIFFNYKFFL